MNLTTVFCNFKFIFFNLNFILHNIKFIECNLNFVFLLFHFVIQTFYFIRLSFYFIFWLSNQPVNRWWRLAISSTLGRVWKKRKKDDKRGQTIFSHFQRNKQDMIKMVLLASQSDAHTIAPHRDPSNPDPDPSHPLIALKQERPMMWYIF